MLILQKIFRLLGTYKRKKEFFVILILILIGTAMEMLGIGIIIPFLALLLDTDVSVTYPKLIPLLDLLGNPTQKQLIYIGMLFMVGLYLTKFLYLIFLSYRQGSFIYGIQADLARSLLGSYLYKPYIFHLERNSSLLIRNTTTEVSFYTASVNSLLSLITQILLLIGVISLLIMIEPLPTLILMFFMGIFGGVFYYFTKNRILQWGKDQQYFNGKIIQYLQQGLGGIKDSKVLGREHYFLNLFQDINLKKASNNKKMYVFDQLPRLWLEILTIISMVFLIIVLLMQGHPVKNIIPTLGLFGVAAYKLMPAVNQLITNIQRIRSKIPSIKIIYEEFDELSLNVLNSDISNSTSHIFEFTNSIEIKQVEFSYPESGSYSLSDVSLSIPKGSAVGIIGISGAGKSTLIDVILGLLPPHKGSVEVDGINIDTNIRAWQNKIGYVSQTIFLTDDTLRNNIALGVKESEIDEKSLTKAINDSQLQEYIDQLPIGLDTIVGERGVRISGGQKQRIGIARALYNNPEVLVLDEATSSLDIETEKKVIDVITDLIGEKTIIIISHRFSAIKNCKNIYRLDSGKVIQTGNFDQIISTLDNVEINKYD
jgi:ATP-binding cassette, subfamily B, bacterial PglK